MGEDKAEFTTLPRFSLSEKSLENVLMKGIALSHSNTFTPELLPDYICDITINSKPQTAETSASKLSLEEMEKIHVARVLEATAWHKGRACEVLNISRPRLRRMINQYKLTPPAANEDEESM